MFLASGKQFLLLITLLFFSFIHQANAFNPRANEELSSGLLELKNDQGKQSQAIMLSTDVQMDISGMTARVRLTQKFKNTSSDWVEGKYLFPLPEKSAVDSLIMKIGERIIVGEIKEKQEAKKIYQQAVISGKKASLVEQHRPNVFSNSVANIAPLEEIQITIEYQQDLLYNADTGFSIRFPMTMTPRYTPTHKLVETFSVSDNQLAVQPEFSEYVSLEQQSASEQGNNVTINATIHSGLPVEYLKSSSHSVIYNKKSDSEHFVELSGSNVKTDRDFVLNWKPVKDSMPRAAIFSEKLKGENYLSIMVMPPELKTDQIQLNREVIFVIDTSGSMGGESILQAKQALISGLETLTFEDSFNIIEFNSNYSSLFSTARNFNSQSKAQALAFIYGLEAQGGTEMLKAMNRALVNQDTTNKLRQVIFLTDGAISNESELFKTIKDRLKNSRLFTVGIGSAPNSFFMKRAAKFGRGTFTYVSDINEAKEKISQLFEKISSPVLSDLQIQWPDNTSVQQWPNKIPDLFQGEPLWVKAKVDNYQGKIMITGVMANQLWESNIPLTAGKNLKGIAKLWAREKIASIMDNSNYGQVSNNEKQEVIEVALKHQLVSQFTSLIAVDKTPSRINEKLRLERLKQSKPKGSSKSKGSKAVQYPKTALDFWMSQSFAMLLLLLASLGLFILKRNG